MVELALSRQRIVYTDMRLSWLEARTAVAGKGGLPPHVLLDEHLNGPEQRWNSVPNNGHEYRGEHVGDANRPYWPGWAREIIVYPNSGEQFMKGEGDVIDFYSYFRWRLSDVLMSCRAAFPESCIPDEAFGREKVALLFTPRNIELNTETGNMFLLAYPKDVILLHPFIQTSGQIGKVDERTGIPLEVSEEEARELPDTQKRMLSRLPHTGIRPLSHGFTAGRHERLGGFTCTATSAYVNMFGVAYVEPLMP